MRPAVRRAVMLDLLAGKVSEPARRLAAFAVGRCPGARSARRPGLGGHPRPPCR